MHTALGVALCSIIVAPSVGRWRANVWLRRRAQAMEAEVRSRTRSAHSNVIEIA